MTTAETNATILLGNAHSRGERIDADYRQPGLYPVGVKACEVREHRAYWEALASPISSLSKP